MGKMKFRPAYRKGFGILNKQGDFWSPDIFDSEDAAKAHVERFWHGFKDVDLSQFTIVLAVQRTSITPAGRSALEEHNG